jgi:hypothetical protein
MTTAPVFTLSPPYPSIISYLSEEPVTVPVSAVSNGTVYNPTGDVVQFAFTVGYGSTPVTWATATWEANPVQGYWYNAKCLVGAPSGTALASATYTVWVKITDISEVPVRQAGTITIQ